MLNEYTPTQLLRNLEFIQEYTGEEYMRISIDDLKQFVVTAIETEKRYEGEVKQLRRKMPENSDAFERGHEFAFRSIDEMLQKFALSMGASIGIDGMISRVLFQGSYLDKAKTVALVDLQKELREIAPEGINW